MRKVAMSRYVCGPRHERRRATSGSPSASTPERPFIPARESSGEVALASDDRAVSISSAFDVAGRDSRGFVGRMTPPRRNRIKPTHSDNLQVVSAPHDRTQCLGSRRHLSELRCAPFLLAL